VAELQRLVRSPAPEQGTDAREQLGKSEGLHEVIVGAGIEALNAILDGVLGREDEDGGLDPPLAKRSQDLEAVATRQHEIQEDEVERILVDEKEGFLARRSDEDVVALRREPTAQRHRHLRFVLDDQDAHVTSTPAEHPVEGVARSSSWST
jgi:hypothetical protein